MDSLGTLKRKRCDGLEVINVDNLNLGRSKVRSNATTSRSVYLPDKAGTIAMTSDVPSVSNLVTTDTTQTITGAKTASGILTVSNSTQSTNAGNGSLVVRGGVGIAKDVFITGSLNAIAIPATSGSESFVVTATTQTFSGVKLWNEGTLAILNSSANGRTFLSSGAAATKVDSFAFPSLGGANDTVVSLGSTQTLTNKTLTSPVVGTSLNCGRGTVTQLTNNSTAVTLNAVSGRITMKDPIGAAQAPVFTVNNTACSATSVIIASVSQATLSVDPGAAFVVWVSSGSAGSFQVQVYNMGSTAVRPAIINFLVC